MNNRNLISKAAIDTTALVNGGKMNAEQAKQFMTYMQDYSPFLKKVNFIKMQKATRDLDNLEVNKRALRRQNENTEHTATGEAIHSRRTLNAVGVIMPYDITFQYMKENIEGKNVNTTLAKMFAQRRLFLLFKWSFLYFACQIFVFCMSSNKNLMKKVIKEELIYTCESEINDQTKAKALFKSKNTLDRLYNEWLKNDLSLNDVIRDTVNLSCEKAVKELKVNMREGR